MIRAGSTKCLGRQAPPERVREETLLPVDHVVLNHDTVAAYDGDTGAPERPDQGEQINGESRFPSTRLDPRHLTSED